MSLLDLAVQPETLSSWELKPAELKPVAEWPLPRWADKHLDGEYELYAQLATKVGERAGNGVVVFEGKEKASAKA